MNFTKIFCVTLFVVLFFFVWLVNAKPENQIVNQKFAESSDTPRSVYAKNCARCHGADGRAQTDYNKDGDLPSFADADWQRGTSDKHIANKIIKGGGGMPAFGKKLSQSEIKSLVGYVRSLKR